MSNERLPKCLWNLGASEIFETRENARRFSLFCDCGQSILMLLGYSMESESCRGETVFVSPLSIDCPSCGKRTLFFDSELHGYDGQLGASASIRGSGPPTTWKCPECRETMVRIEVRFVYAVEPDDPFENRTEDDFTEIAVDCECNRCKSSSSATSIDCI